MILAQCTDCKIHQLVRWDPKLMKKHCTQQSQLIYLSLKHAVGATKVVCGLGCLSDCLSDVELRSGNARIIHHLKTVRENIS